MPSPLSRGKRIIFAAITVVLAWALLEVGALVLSWLALGEAFSVSELQLRRERQISQFGVGDYFGLAHVHPYVGYVEEPRPGSAFAPFRGGPAVPVSEFGYIDDKLPFQTRGPGRVVIGIVGGSVACLFAVNGTKRLEAELAKDSRFAGKELVFVNLALGGYKQPQQLITLAYLLSLGAEFDVVLNIDGFNEVAVDNGGDSGASSQFPAYPQNWRRRLANSDTYLSLTRSKLLSLGGERADLARRFARSPWRYSIICNLVWELLDRRLDRRIAHVLDSYQQMDQRRAHYAATGPHRDFATSEDRFKFLAEIWANSSVQLNRLCRSNGIRYYHFLQPNQYLAGSKPMRDDEKRLAILADHAFANRVKTGYPLLIQKDQYLRSLGESYHDLTGIFAGHLEALYIDNCCHYNQEGYEIMAEAIARAMLSDD